MGVEWLFKGIIPWTGRILGVPGQVGGAALVVHLEYSGVGVDFAYLSVEFVLALLPVKHGLAIFSKLLGRALRDRLHATFVQELRVVRWIDGVKFVSGSHHVLLAGHFKAVDEHRKVNRRDLRIDLAVIDIFLVLD